MKPERGIQCGIALSIMSCALIATPAIAQTKVAVATSHCLSANLGVASAHVGGYLLESGFTTYDGSASLPLHEQVGDYVILSGELIPKQGSPGTYLTDFIQWIDGVASSYGTVEVVYPTTDTDANGVPDFLQLDRSGNVSFSGTGYVQYPAVSTFSIHGTITRAAGSSQGSYSATTTSDTLQAVYTGNTHIFGGHGSFEYSRTQSQNQGTLQMQLTDNLGQRKTYTATSPFTVQSVSQISFPEMIWHGSDNSIVVSKVFSLTRTGKIYRGTMEFYDGLPTTSWKDYATWVLEISDSNDADGDGIPDLSDDIVNPPAITSHPISRTVSVGDSVTFSVSATGSEPLAYRWRKDGVALADATLSSYSIGSVQGSDQGAYDVTVSNSAGTVAGQSAMLTVVRPPSIVTQPQSRTVSVGDSVTFRVMASGTQPLSYQWRRDQVPLPAATTHEYVIANAQKSDQGGYDVIISNSSGTVTSALAALVVTEPVQEGLRLSIKIINEEYLLISWFGVQGRQYALEVSPSIKSTWAVHTTEPEIMHGINRDIQILVPFTGDARLFRVRDADTLGLSPAGMVWIPPGTFMMGAPEDEEGRIDSEGPQTDVTISRGFWMGKYEVTQGEYLEVMGSNPSWVNGVRGSRDYGTDLNRPVEQVSWDAAVAYCEALTARERSAGRIPISYAYRLPTEAEWEYACRAGTTTRFSYGDDPGYVNLTHYAWYWDNSDGQTHPVGQKLPNLWGLYDMHGNVFEWCQDWFGNYAGGIALDPQGPAIPSPGSHRVIRGGYWNYWGDWGNPRNCRSAYRGSNAPDSRISIIGFRAVLAPGQP